MNRFLVVEDVSDSATWLADRLRAVWGNDISVDFAVTLRQARRQLAIHRYECVIVDIGLPDGSGIELLREQQSSQEAASFVVATIHDDDEHIFSALRCGARGYLLKDAPAEEIEKALHGMRDGIPPLSPAIALRMMEFFSASPVKEEPASLTERERSVLVLIARGLSVAEAAASLQISVHTVRGYVKEIYRKLGISSRAEASLKASRMGLIRD